MCLSCTIEQVTGVDLQEESGHDELDQIRAANGGRIPWPDATREMEEAAAYVAALYANPEGGTGGPLHITTDDYNVSDENLRFCRDETAKWAAGDSYADDKVAAARVGLLADWILDLITPMTEAERSMVMAIAHGSLAVVHGKVFMPRTEFPIREEHRDEEGHLVGTSWGFRTRTVEGDAQ